MDPAYAGFQDRNDLSVEFRENVQVLLPVQYWYRVGYGIWLRLIIFISCITYMFWYSIGSLSKPGYNNLDETF